MSSVGKFRFWGATYRFKHILTFYYFCLIAILSKYTIITLDRQLSSTFVIKSWTLLLSCINNYTITYTSDPLCFFGTRLKAQQLLIYNFLVGKGLYKIEWIEERLKSFPSIVFGSLLENNHKNGILNNHYKGCLLKFQLQSRIFFNDIIFYKTVTFNKNCSSCSGHKAFDCHL